ncbi:hypothetical protein BDZ45DRAFT_697743 [Acephala macrosclerotiorum]|nr:hypothetical protein BDZ45DRAFT_697743 [Acephala macrosclerotiorum]
MKFWTSLTFFALCEMKSLLSFRVSDFQPQVRRPPSQSGEQSAVEPKYQASDSSASALHLHTTTTTTMVNTNDDTRINQAAEQSLDGNASLVTSRDYALRATYQICERCQSIDLSRAHPERPGEISVAVDLSGFEVSSFCDTCGIFVEHLERIERIERIKRIEPESNNKQVFLVPFRTSDLFWDPCSPRLLHKPSLIMETTSFIINNLNVPNKISVLEAAQRQYFLTPSVLNRYYRDSYRPFRHASLGKKVDFDRVRGFLNFCQTHHVECKRHNMDRKSRQQIRVIDCQSKNVVWLKGWCEGSYKPQKESSNQSAIYSLGRIESDRYILASCWGSRGWTYQEAVFSGRQVVFGQENVWVQCHRMVFSERMEVRNEDLSLSQAGPRMPDAKWHFLGVDRQPDQEVPAQVWSHICQYSYRELSMHKDGLRAFFGILCVFKEAHPDLYHISGLPISYRAHNSSTTTESFAYSLTWCHLRESAERISDFPSWSWLGWKLGSSILEPRYEDLGRRLHWRHPFDVSINISSLPIEGFLQVRLSHTLTLDTIPLIEITAPAVDLELTVSNSYVKSVRMVNDYTHLSAYANLDRAFPDSTAIRGTAILLFYHHREKYLPILQGTSDTTPRLGEKLYMLLVVEGTGFSERIGLITIWQGEGRNGIAYILPAALKNHRKILLG